MTNALPTDLPTSPLLMRVVKREKENKVKKREKKREKKKDNVRKPVEKGRILPRPPPRSKTHGHWAGVANLKKQLSDSQTDQPTD